MNAQKTLDRIQLYLSLIGSLLILIDLGYRNDPLLTISLDGAVRITFYVLFANCALLTIGSVMTTRKLTARTWSSLILIAFGLAIVLSGQESWMYSGVFLLTLTEISKNTLFFDRLYFNPTILFVVSFLLLITIGADRKSVV